MRLPPRSTTTDAPLTARNAPAVRALARIAATRKTPSRRRRRRDAAAVLRAPSVLVESARVRRASEFSVNLGNTVTRQSLATKGAPSCCT